MKLKHWIEMVLVFFFSSKLDNAQKPGSILPWKIKFYIIHSKNIRVLKDANYFVLEY